MFDPSPGEAQSSRSRDAYSYGLRASASLARNRDRKCRSSNFDVLLMIYSSFTPFLYLTTRAVVIPTINQNNGEHRLLKHKNIFDAGEEEMTGQSTKSSKKESKSQAKTYQCLGQRRVVCGRKNGKKLLLCHHEGEGNFRSICMRKKKISGHLMNHPEDYCGKCETTITTSR